MNLDTFNAEKARELAYDKFKEILMRDIYNAALKGQNQLQVNSLNNEANVFLKEKGFTVSYRVQNEEKFVISW